MSYHATAALQTTVFTRLTGWAGLAAIPVVDAVPTGAVPTTFVLIGPETARDQSDKTGPGAEHEIEISVISTASGFLAAKNAAAQVSLALADPGMTLSTGHLVNVNFVRATAKRLDEGDTRRIDLRFRVRIGF